MELTTLLIGTLGLLAGIVSGLTWHQWKSKRRPTFAKAFSPLASNGGSAKIVTALERAIGEHGSPRRLTIYSVLLSCAAYTVLSLRSHLRQSLIGTADVEWRDTDASAQKQSALQHDSIDFAKERTASSG